MLNMDMQQKRERDRRRAARYIERCGRERAAENARMEAHRRHIEAGGSCGWTTADTCITTVFMVLWGSMFL